MISASAFFYGVRALEQRYEQGFDGERLKTWLAIFSAGEISDDQFLKSVDWATRNCSSMPCAGDLICHIKLSSHNNGNPHEAFNLLGEIEKLAEEKTDGHYTILKFTTCYQGMLGTICVDGGRRGREELKFLPSFSTLPELLRWILEEQVSVFDIPWSKSGIDAD